jgi:hypothetical protein
MRIQRNILFDYVAHIGSLDPAARTSVDIQRKWAIRDRVPDLLYLR